MTDGVLDAWHTRLADFEVNLAVLQLLPQDQGDGYYLSQEFWYDLLAVIY